MQNWTKEFGAGITIIDTDFMIVYMNSRASEIFERWGGQKLLGKSVLDCHQEKSKAIMRRIMETGEPNSYTIEKNGIKKIIHQAPWKKDGAIAGLVEISIEIPSEMDHFVR